MKTTKAGQEGLAFVRACVMAVCLPRGREDELQRAGETHWPWWMMHWITWTFLYLCTASTTQLHCNCPTEQCPCWPKVWNWNASGVQSGKILPVLERSRKKGNAGAHGTGLGVCHLDGLFPHCGVPRGNMDGWMTDGWVMDGRKERTVCQKSHKLLTKMWFAHRS